MADPAQTPVWERLVTAAITAFVAVTGFLGWRRQAKKDVIDQAEVTRTAQEARAAQREADLASLEAKLWTRFQGEFTKLEEQSGRQAGTIERQNVEINSLKDRVDELEDALDASRSSERQKDLLISELRLELQAMTLQRDEALKGKVLADARCQELETSRNEEKLGREESEAALSTANRELEAWRAAAP